MTYGAGAACMLADLVANGFSVGGAPLVSGCFAYACDGLVAGALDVVVYGQTRTCAADGDALEFDAYVGSVTCPPYSIVCGREAVGVEDPSMEPVVDVNVRACVCGGAVEGGDPPLALPCQSSSASRNGVPDAPLEVGLGSR